MAATTGLALLALIHGVPGSLSSASAMRHEGRSPARLHRHGLGTAAGFACAFLLGELTG